MVSNTTEQESVVNIDSLELCSVASTCLTILFQHQLKMDEWDLDMDRLKTTEQDREERFNLYFVVDKLFSGPVEDE